MKTSITLRRNRERKKHNTVWLTVTGAIDSDRTPVLTFHLRVTEIIANNLNIAVLLFKERHMPAFSELNPFRPCYLLEEWPNALVLRFIIDRVNDESRHNDRMESVDHRPRLQRASDCELRGALPVQVQFSTYAIILGKTKESGGTHIVW